MPKYHHVLLASDLSKTSEQVAQKANQIAKDSSAELSVVHVMEHSPVAYGGEFSIPVNANLEQVLETQAREELASLSSHFGIDGEHQFIEHGSVKIAVTQLVFKLSADLIVVGTHGHHGIDRLLGSRANAILHMAQCDVLVVKVSG